MLKLMNESRAMTSENLQDFECHEESEKSSKQHKHDETAIGDGSDEETHG